MQTRLVRGQCDMLAELAHELAVGARKAVVGTACRDDHAEHPVVDLQRGQHGATQPAAGQPPRERQVEACEVGLVHQLAAQAARQRGIVDQQPRLLDQAEAACHLLTARADAAHRCLRVVHVAQRHHAEVDRQLLLDAVRDDLQDVALFEPVADRPGDAAQQLQPHQLVLQPVFDPLAFLDLVAQLPGALVDRGLEVLVQVGQLVLHPRQLLIALHRRLVGRQQQVEDLQPVRRDEELAPGEEDLHPHLRRVTTLQMAALTESQPPSTSARSKRPSTCYINAGGKYISTLRHRITSIAWMSLLQSG